MSPSNTIYALVSSIAPEDAPKHPSAYSHPPSSLLLSSALFISTSGIIRRAGCIVRGAMFKAPVLNDAAYRSSLSCLCPDLHLSHHDYPIFLSFPRDERLPRLFSYDLTSAFFGHHTHLSIGPARRLTAVLGRRLHSLGSRCSFRKSGSLLYSSLVSFSLD